MYDSGEKVNFTIFIDNGRIDSERGREMLSLFIRGALQKLIEKYCT